MSDLNESAIIITYTLTADDLSDFSIYCISHIPANRRGHTLIKGIVLIISALLGAACWWFLQSRIAAHAAQGSSVVSPNLIWEAPLAVALGGMSLVFLGFAFAFDRLIEQNIRTTLTTGEQPKAVRLQLVPHSFYIEPDGYTACTETGQTFQVWRAVDQLRFTDDACYLFNTPCTAVIIPRRAVEAHMPWAEFSDLIRTYVDSAAQDEPQAATAHPAR